VVTIHDCIHLMFPQYLPGHLAYAYAKLQLWTAAHRSDRVLTVSEASKLDILRRFRVPADKITVVYNAIDERLSLEPTDEDVERVSIRYQLKDPFALYVGNIKPHKNLERLIEAFHQLRQESAFETLKLVIIGDEISKYQGLRRAVHVHKLHKHVRFLGFVPLETLSVLYRLASVFVFPSLYEGFGLPPLEAMYYGTPVVTSNVSSLPEVVGDAAMLVDPYSSESIADGMRRVLTDEHLRASLRERGMARAREFSWERSVRRIREVYGEVMERPEPT
jgi:glycosyltransferase involved in cell wall biosynthesis